MRIERFAGLFVMAAVAFGITALTSPALADSGYCSYSIVCQGDPIVCEVQSVSCIPFASSNCDQSCDWENYYCEYDCAAEGGSPIECDRECRAVYLACIQACYQ